MPPTPYSCSGGRVLLAYQPVEWQELYLRRVKLVAHTPSTLVNKTELRKMLRQIRETGLARTHGDVQEGVSAFAAPVFGRTGDVIAALALAAPTSRADEKQDIFARLVLQAASDISAVMGFIGPAAPGAAPLAG